MGDRAVRGAASGKVKAIGFGGEVNRGLPRHRRLWDSHIFSRDGLKALSALGGGEGWVRWGPAAMALRARSVLARTLWRGLRETGLPWKFRRLAGEGGRAA